LSAEKFINIKIGSQVSTHYEKWGKFKSKNGH